MTESKTFMLPSLPPSVNTIYQINFAQRRVYLHPEVARWKTEMKVLIPKLTPSKDSFTFRLDAVFTYSWYYKNGKMRKFDTHNLMKVLCDAIAEKNGFDDSYIKAGSWDSKHLDREMVECRLSQVEIVH